MDLLAGYGVFYWIATWANPLCDILFRGMTDLGSVAFYVMAIAPLFWVVNRRRASVLILLLLASSCINTVAKLWFHTPRPDPHLARVLDLRPYESGSNAFPSGHAQNAVVFWGYAALWIREGRFSIAAMVLIAAISFSRLYLAVHFPIDVAGGLAIGAGILGAAPALERWSRTDFRLGLAGALLLLCGSLTLTVVSADLTCAALSGSLIGFWPPPLGCLSRHPPPLVPASPSPWSAAGCCCCSG
jgi:membrane-associated phospholipid phosphatase